jgi:RNA polymerase sigma factor (sigma-70 family)
MATLGSEAADLREMNPIRLAHQCADNPQDSELWTEFLRRFTPKIYNFLRSTLRQYKGGKTGSADSISFIDSNQESDLFQNVVLRLVQNNCLALKRFSGETESDLLVYLAVITRSTVRDSMRYKSAKRRFYWFSSPTVRYNQSDKDYEYVREPGVEDAVERDILTREIEELSLEAIQSDSGNPDRDKLIFQFYYHDGLSAAQISSCKGIGLSKTGIEKIISRLKEKVRKAAGVHPIEARS